MAYQSVHYRFSSSLQCLWNLSFHRHRYKIRNKRKICHHLLFAGNSTGIWLNAGFLVGLYIAGQCCVNCGAAACSNPKCIRYRYFKAQISIIKLFPALVHKPDCFAHVNLFLTGPLTARMAVSQFPAPRLLKRRRSRSWRIPNTGRKLGFELLPVQSNCTTNINVTGTVPVFSVADPDPGGFKLFGRIRYSRYKTGSWIRPVFSHTGNSWAFKQFLTMKILSEELKALHPAFLSSPIFALFFQNTCSNFLHILLCNKDPDPVWN